MVLRLPKAASSFPPISATFILFISNREASPDLSSGNRLVPCLPSPRVSIRFGTLATGPLPLAINLPRGNASRINGHSKTP